MNGQQVTTKRLSFFDKWLTLWISLAIVIGVGLGAVVPGISGFWGALSLGTTNIPLAICLVLMMFPPFAKVRYNRFGLLFRNTKVLSFSVLLNWVIGPFLMTFLGFLFLADSPALLTGLILIGLARCIAMVVVWNDLANGDREACASLVAFNAIFQILFFALYAYLFVTVIPRAFGFGGQSISIDFWQVALSVLTYLGLPFGLGYLVQKILRKRKGDSWFEDTLVPKIAGITPVTLLITIIVMCSMKSPELVANPISLVKVGIPLVLYFVIMFVLTYAGSRLLRVEVNIATSLSFTAASNNFELAIAVAVGVFGIGSDQALAAVIGPLIEVPVMVALVKLVPVLQKVLYRIKAKKEGSL